ncbi:MAG: hypothetical protein M5U28_08315 [Sandaracinaceae bacterium]|nr:hypothetical protein [Sandaracinaceae bacterium]
MRVRLLYFAAVRELVGITDEVRELPSGGAGRRRARGAPRAPAPLRSAAVSATCASP